MVSNQFNVERVNSVIYSENGGISWQISKGTMLDERYWAQWEPTVWEMPNGVLSMIYRNGLGSDPAGYELKWNESLVYSYSTDMGKTWSEPEILPYETVVSRMHVIGLSDVSTQSENSRFIMTHNDWHLGVPSVVQDRKSLSLYFTRGSGTNFVAGLNYTGITPLVFYPCMYVKDESMYIVYTEGLNQSNIALAKISYLPDEGKYYVFPRNRSYPSQSKTGSIAYKDGSIIFNGESSAGIDMDHYDKDSIIHFDFSFTPIRGENYIVASVGDINNILRIAVQGSKVVIKHAGAVIECGALNGGLNDVGIIMEGTEVHVALNGGDAVKLDMGESQRLIYLGQMLLVIGQYEDINSSFSVDPKSISTLVEKPDK